MTLSLTPPDTKKRSPAGAQATPRKALGTWMTCRLTGEAPDTFQTKTYSFDRSGMNFPSGP